MLIKGKRFQIRDPLLRVTYPLDVVDARGNSVCGVWAGDDEKFNVDAVVLCNAFLRVDFCSGCYTTP